MESPNHNGWVMLAVRAVPQGLQVGGIETRPRDLEVLAIDAYWDDEFRILMRVKSRWPLMRLVMRTVGKLILLHKRAAERAYAPGGNGYKEVAAATLVGKRKSPE